MRCTGTRVPSFSRGSIVHRQFLRLRFLALVAGIALSAFSGWASADPPSRVARLGYLSGAVSFSPAGESDWDQAAINRPLTTGDRLWVDAGSRAEIQVGGALVRMDAVTALSVINLDDRIAQLELTQGSLNVRVLRLATDQVFEVDTPNLAFTLRQAGAYRITVDPDRDTTTIVVRSGQGEAYGEDAAYVIDARQTYRFAGTGLREVEAFNAPPPDDFDRWSSDRDRRYDASLSARYVSPDVVGYQDLDANGTWRVDARYGNVWTPNRVAAGWAPYRDGHWVWIDPWGWTWVDDEPWGFAVSHYGRWANFNGRWGWVPGPVRTPAYYAPALVVFVGGGSFQLTIAGGVVGGVAWFPLGPREVYRPAYPVSRSYFENINRSNTVINTNVINNTYNNTNLTDTDYANRRVPGAVVAVPKTTFLQSLPVSRAVVQVVAAAIAGRPLAVAPAVAPTQKSVRGAAARADKPPARAFERPVIARTAPPAAHPGFAAQEAQLAATPGKPLDDTARRQLKPAATTVAPVVKLVVPAPGSPRELRAPPPAPAAKGGDANREPVEPKARTAPAAAAASRPTPAAAPTPAPVPRAAPAQARPPATVAQPPEERGRPEPRARAEQRGQPTTPTQAAPAPAATQPEPPPAVTPTPRPAEARPAPAAQPRAQAATSAASKPEAAVAAPVVKAVVPTPEAPRELRPPTMPARQAGPCKPRVR